MPLTNEQKEAGRRAIEKMTEAAGEFRSSAGMSAASFGPDGHCRTCDCPAFVWRLFDFPDCGRDKCEHDVSAHDVL